MRNYKILGVDRYSGTFVVHYEGLSPLNFFIPHDGESFLTGEALEQAIQAMYPEPADSPQFNYSSIANIEAIEGLIDLEAKAELEASMQPKEPTEEPAPEFDPFTQYITLNQITDPMQETVGWTIHDMTAEEIAEYLANWRSEVAVTMRQARLALAQQGLLQTVEDAIALIPEPDKSAISIEWEYSAVVERASAWVGVLAPALGLSDEQLDDLFKLALTL